MKKWMIFVAVLSLLLSLTGCGAEKADDGEITLGKMLLCYRYESYDVYITGMETTDRGVEIGMKIENLSGYDYWVLPNGLAVNGYMMPNSGMNTEVPAGETVQDVLLLKASDLEKAGIDTVAEIAFSLEFFNTFSGVQFYESSRMRLHTSAPMDYVQPVHDAGEEILNENDLRVVCKGLRSDEIWDGELVFHFDNGCYKDVTFHVENITVNGVAQEQTLQRKISAFTKCVDGVALENIDDAETVEFTLRAVDNYGKELAHTETISLNFE